MTKGNGTNGKDTRSLRDRIAAAPQLAKKLVEIPEWEGIMLELRGLSLGWRSRIMRDGYATIGEGSNARPSPVFEKFYPLILAGSCFDPSDGKPVFAGDLGEEAFRACNLTAEQQQAIEQFINTLNPKVVDRIAKDVMLMSGLSSEGSEKNAGAESPSDTPASLSPSSST